MILTIWWCPCVESSLVLEEGVHYDQCILLAKLLLAFSLLYVIVQGQIYLLLQVSLSFLLLHSSPLRWKGHLFFSLMLALESLVGLHRTIQLQLLQLEWLDIDLDYCGFEWCALETNWDHHVIFEIAPKYYISESFVDHVGYSISSKGFLPTVVDVMVIWIKFTPAHLL